MVEEVDIERVTEEESEYLNQLRSRYSKKDVYSQYLGTVKQFLAQKDLKLESLSEFYKNEDIGVVYVLVEERFRTIHHNLVGLLLDGIKGDERKRELEALMRVYRENFIKTYSQFLKERSEAALLFETVCRKLFQEGIEKWFSHNPSSSSEKSFFISEVSAKVDALLTPLRLNLGKERKLDVFLFSETFSKSPLIPSPLSKLTLHDIEVEILKYGLTPNLFEKVAKEFQSAIQKELEDEILNSLRSRTIRSKQDIVRSIEHPLYSISADCVKTLRQIIVEKVSERLLDLTQVLKNLHQELERRKEKFDQVISEIMLSGKKALMELREEELDACVENFTKIADSIKAEMDEIKMKKEEVERELRSAKNLQGLNSEELTSIILNKNEREIERYLHIYRALSTKFGRDLEHIPSQYTETFSELIKEELALLRSKSSPSYGSLSSLEERRFWKKHYKVEELKTRWMKICTEVLEPLLITKYIEELVRIWPPAVSGRTPTRPYLTAARYVGEELAFNGRLYQLGKPASSREVTEQKKLEKLRRLIVDNFKEVVSVIVYDIRGSTFMGNKLNNAKKESEIRNNFNIKMMRIARAHGAFVVKDTGDGGILFFSGNSRELERKFTTDPKAKFYETNLVASKESAKKAIECARDMVQGAFSFVEENLEKYGDWFEDVRKESLRYAGITYAQLPPEYKRIFKVGIGIASGKPDVDIYFGPNGFGSPDITGGLVREANFYSKARSRERSIILCDGATLLSFLLNVDEYEPEIPQPTRTKSLERESLGDLLREAMWNYANLKKRKKGYKFGKLGIFIERVGTQIFYDQHLESNLSLSTSGLKITESGEFLDERDRKVKILYQIIPEWMK